MSEVGLQTKTEGQNRDPVARPELSEEAIGSIVAMLRVLGDPTRIRLIEALNERGRATVSALNACLEMTQQNVSRQLSILHQAGIVSRCREGVWVYYELIDFSGWWLIEQLVAERQAH
jgi:DNA-binding transcriptional ArsR family regulator